jgi:hypothetical protein
VRTQRNFVWLIIFAIVVLSGWALLPHHPAWFFVLRPWVVWRPLLSDRWTLRVAAGLLVVYAVGLRVWWVRAGKRPSYDTQVLRSCLVVMACGVGVLGLLLAAAAAIGVGLVVKIVGAVVMFPAGLMVVGLIQEGAVRVWKKFRSASGGGE